jgi:hypothetical protein
MTVETRTVTLGDLILLSIHVDYKKGKVLFSIGSMIKLFDDSIKAPVIDYQEIENTLLAVFHRVKDGFHLDYKTKDYEPIILKLFPERIDIPASKIDWLIKDYCKGVLPSERYKKKGKIEILELQIEKENKWILKALKLKAIAKGLTREQYALNILKKVLEIDYEGQDDIKRAIGGKKNVKRENENL